ncbi:hypothetical protein [Escherichia coli]|uniref:hypothetical protein n=1 Tax=Escherichia coli TaxID=562 RepID=UPI0029F3B3E7|nr:hypothetical protein [Escherichia coli]
MLLSQTLPPAGSRPWSASGIDAISQSYVRTIGNPDRPSSLTGATLSRGVINDRLPVAPLTDAIRQRTCVDDCRTASDLESLSARQSLKTQPFDRPGILSPELTFVAES